MSRAPLIVLEDKQVYVATREQWRNLRSRAITANAGSFSVTFFLGGPLCIRMSPINRTRNIQKIKCTRHCSMRILTNIESFIYCESSLYDCERICSQLPN